VYLAERGPAIGGVMAQLDKTFPTNDCAMCTMAPRLVEIGRHKDIEILTLSEVERVEGQPGDFTVTIRKQPRYIDAAKCTGCGACTTECPVTLASEFDQGLGERKAIYRPFPQAVPNIFSISRRGTSPCQAGCPIHQSAQGYVTLIAQGRFEEALQVILRDNPIPSICGKDASRRRSRSFCETTRFRPFAVASALTRAQPPAPVRTWTIRSICRR